MSFLDSLLHEAREIPFASRASYMTQLMRPVVHEEPQLTKRAAVGKLKIAMMAKRAQDEEEYAQELEDAAMVDPDVQEALDYEQLMAEREDFMMQLQEMEGALAEAQAMAAQAEQRAAQAEQMAQEAQMQNQELNAQVEQEFAGRQQATQAAMQAQDQSLQEQIAHQQHRMQLAQAADEFAQQADSLSQQLKQVAASNPLQQQQQEEQMMAEEQATAEEQAAMTPTSRKAQKQQEEADRTAMKAEEQAVQAEQTRVEDAQKFASAGLKQIGRRLAAGAALGATLGGGYGAAQSLYHDKKFGRDQPSNKEIELANRLNTEMTKLERTPSLSNKIKAIRTRADLELATAQRMHPIANIGRKALHGAIVGTGAGAAYHLHKTPIGAQAAKVASLQKIASQLRGAWLRRIDDAQ
jgi:myosin heavy subunit